MHLLRQSISEVHQLNLALLPVYPLGPRMLYSSGKVKVMRGQELVYLCQNWSESIQELLHISHQRLARYSKFLQKSLPTWYKLHRKR